MKLNLKMIAAAAAIVVTGSANAGFVDGSFAPGDSTLALLAFNVSTGAYYVRDLGFTLSTFTPSNGAAITASGDLGTFDKTPATGLTLNAGNTTNFSDASFSSWLASTTAADVKWTVVASDSQGVTATNRKREISTLAVGSTFTIPVSNGTIDNGVLAVNGIVAPGAVFGLSQTGTWNSTQLGNANGNFYNQNGKLAGLGASENLYYFTRTTQTGSTPTAANQIAYGNAAGLAVLTLASNGDFSYVLAPVSAVPLPAAAWMMGAGLMAMGGVLRRRRAAAEA